MKPTVLFLFTILLLASFSPASAGITNSVRASSTGQDSNVQVRINNNVNTGGNTSTSSVKSETTTKIDIDQEGEGTSSVNINGTEYKVEGQGSLHIDETTTGFPTQTITPSISATPSASPSPTSTPENDLANESFIENLFNQIRENFKKIFGNFFD